MLLKTKVKLNQILIVKGMNSSSEGYKQNLQYNFEIKYHQNIKAPPKICSYRKTMNANLQTIQLLKDFDNGHLEFWPKKTK